MPTLLVVEGFRFFFFGREGTEPPHVMWKKEMGTPSPGSLRWSSSTLEGSPGLRPDVSVS